MRKDFSDKIFRKNPDVVFRVIAGEAILVPVGEKAQTAGRLFTLNETGAFIWERIDGKRNLRAIVRAVCQAYDIDEAPARRDATRLLTALQKLGAVKQV